MLTINARGLPTLRTNQASEIAAVSRLTHGSHVLPHKVFSNDYGAQAMSGGMQSLRASSWVSVEVSRSKKRATHMGLPHTIGASHGGQFGIRESRIKAIRAKNFILGNSQKRNGRPGKFPKPTVAIIGQKSPCQ